MTVAERWTQTERADPNAASIIRRRLRAWALALPLESEVVDDIVLASYEALANVVEHAYESAAEPGTMTLTAAYDRSGLTVTVADTGTWRLPRPTTKRNHGMEVAAAISDRLDVDHRPGVGTVVTVFWTLPAAGHSLSR